MFLSTCRFLIQISWFIYIVVPEDPFTSSSPKSCMLWEHPACRPIQAGIHHVCQPSQRLCPSSYIHDPRVGRKVSSYVQGHSISALGRASPCSPPGYTCVVTLFQPASICCLGVSCNPFLTLGSAAFHTPQGSLPCAW